MLSEGFHNVAIVRVGGKIDLPAPGNHTMRRGGLSSLPQGGM